MDGVGWLWFIHPAHFVEFNFIFYLPFSQVNLYLIEGDIFHSNLHLLITNEILKRNVQSTALFGIFAFAALLISAAGKDRIPPKTNVKIMGVENERRQSK